MAARPSLELLKGVEKLNQPCRDHHLIELASSVTNWQSIAPFLGLNKPQIEEIEKDSPNVACQRAELFRKWCEIFGEKATYITLANALNKCERGDLVSILCKILKESEEQYVPEHPEETNRRVRCRYANFLQDKYRSGIPTFLSLQWPPPPTRKIFNLAMITEATLRYGPSEEKAKLLLMGDVGGVMRSKNKVTLKQISARLHTKGCYVRGRRITLIEGAPGAGKSTLAWHMCQMWETGELFKDFEIVLFVRLRDPDIQTARSLDDLFPDDLSMKSEVVRAIQYCGGHNVVLVLDGWDEFPPGLHGNSLISKLICNPSSLNMQFSALIITSRPIATAGLQHFATSRVEIVGFMPTEVDSYFLQAIGTPHTEKLKEHLKERPVIEACCYLPINAAIITHVFLALKYTLPTTLHGIFTSLVLCSIKRHLTKQAREGEEVNISSLNDLPVHTEKQLRDICTLAYYGVRENKVTFSAADLKRYHLPTEPSTLGLIQGYPIHTH